jgi:DNA transformation protein
MHEFLEDRLRKLPELEIRAMFGGAGIYADGAMFGIAHGGRVYFKTSPASRTAFVELGMKPFRPPRGAVLKSYYEVPPGVVDDEAELVTWARKALASAAAPSRSTKARTVAPAEILERHSSGVRELAERLRKVVLEEAPEAEEAGYAGWRLIGYRSPHYFCFVAPQADHVRLGFEHGVRLGDPDGLLEPMGKQVRFVRCTPGRALPLRAIRSLIRAALKLPPLSRRGR